MTEQTHRIGLRFLKVAASSAVLAVGLSGCHFKLETDQDIQNRLRPDGNAINAELTEIETNTRPGQSEMVAVALTAVNSDVFSHVSGAQTNTKPTSLKDAVQTIRTNVTLLEDGKIDHVYDVGTGPTSSQDMKILRSRIDSIYKGSRPGNGPPVS